MPTANNWILTGVLHPADVGSRRSRKPRLFSAVNCFEAKLTAEANLLIAPNLDAANISYNLLRMAAGQGLTVGGILLSIATAYAAINFNNIMDTLQLVFSFVNAPLFATFLLGMFWKRTTGHGAFTGLLGGTMAAAFHHALTLPQGGVPGVKGGWIATMHVYPSEMAQNFWTAIYAWTTCFVITIVVSLLTRAHEEKELVGLVYSLTERPTQQGLSWYQRPAVLAVVVLAATALLNIVFR